MVRIEAPGFAHGPEHCMYLRRLVPPPPLLFSPRLTHQTPTQRYAQTNLVAHAPTRPGDRLSPILSFPLDIPIGG